VEQGLLNNTVNTILQTQDGYLWVGTAGGLQRFDGLNFTRIGDETAMGLKGEPITTLLEAKDKALWIGTQGSGVFRFWHGQVVHIAKEQGLADNAVTSLAEDTNGCVWIGTQQGLNRWQAGHLTLFASKAMLVNDAVVALHSARSGTMWVTTSSGVFRMHDGRVEPFHLDNIPQWSDDDLRGVYEDRVGNLWAFSSTFLLNISQSKRYNAFQSLDPASLHAWKICEQDDGTFWIATSARGLVQFRDGQFDLVGARDGLDQCDVRDLFTDREGNLWIGTGSQGLVRLKTRQWRMFNGSNGLASIKLTALATDPDGSLWVGSEDAGLMRWNGSRFYSFTDGSPMNCAMHIQSLCVDGQGALWVATWGQGLFRIVGGRLWHYGTAEGLSDNIVTALAVEPGSEAVWAGTRSGGLHRVSATNILGFTAADGLPGKSVSCLLAVSNQPDCRLVIGFEGGGLVRWNGNGILPVTIPPALADHSVQCLAWDKVGHLWVGTEGAGAFCQYDGRWLNLTSESGLESDNIRQIIQDESGNMWFDSDAGVFRISAAETRSFLAGASRSVTNLLCASDQGQLHMKESSGWPGVVCDSRGTLWFAAEGRLLAVNPLRIRAAAVPSVMIEQVSVDGQALPLAKLNANGQPIRLGPYARSLDFSFTAISFTASENIRIRHKLEGFDGDWVQGDVARRAHYGPLPPGNYRFRVMATSADGVSSAAEAVLAVVVSPAFWRTWWFLMLSSVALVAMIWTVIRFVSVRRLEAELRRSEQQRSMERERTRIAQDMHDEIGSKLSRISYLSEVARKAVEMLPEAIVPVTAIAGTSRELLQALDEIVWAVNPRNDNLEHLAGYLEQYAREYFQATAVECQIFVPLQLPVVTLNAEVRHNVFLAFEEVLANALRHARPTLVGVEMSVNDHIFEILVRDNGRGFITRNDEDKAGHDGLSNMRERLQAVGGSCDMTSEPGAGTSVRLTCPLPLMDKSK